MVKINSQGIHNYLVIFIVVMITTTTCYVNSKSSSKKGISDNVLNFLQRNGKTHISFASMDLETLKVKEMLLTLLRNSKLVPKLRSRILDLSDFDAAHRYHEDTLVLLVSATSKHLKTYIDIITKTKIMSCVVVCIGKCQRRQLEELRTSLQNESQNTLFYWIGPEEDNQEIMDWKQIMSVKNSKKSLATSMKVDSLGRMKLEKNMNGFHINCSTLSWQPWFKLSDCKGENNSSCSGVGYLADVMNFLGKRFNFTWSCDAEPEGNWGHKHPISGPRNSSGSWGGVFGNVVNGTYPLCVSVWLYFDWRKGLLDFAPISSRENFLAAYFPSSSNYDPELFIRPFAVDSWACAGTLALVIMSIVLVGHWFERWAEQRDGRPTKLAGIKLIVVIGCIYSVVTLNGFYDGALTMFFAKETTIPFESELDILEAYPTWTYNIRKEAFFNIYSRAEKNKVYQKFITLMEDNPEKFSYKNIEEGIKRIKSGQTIIRAGHWTLSQYYKEHPSDKRPNTIYLPLGAINQHHLIFTENSPLLPMFKSGSVELWETGLLKALEAKWMGKRLNEPNSDPLHTVVLSLGQMMLVFSILGAAILLSIIILGIEVFWNYIKNSGILKYFASLKS